MEIPERSTHENEDTNGSQRVRPSQQEDHDRTIIASGIPFSEGGNLQQKLEEIFSALDNDVSSKVNIRGVTRFRSRDQRPGLVKISFDSVDEKVLVLRNKMSLKTSADYKEVNLKSSKSRAELLIEQNARALLRHLPQGRNLRVTANGRIQVRQQEAESN